MTTLYKLQAVWSGIAGMPGTSTLYSLAIPDVEAVDAFFTAIAGALPSGLTISIPGSGDTIESTTGELTGSWSVGADQTAAGASSFPYAAPTGGLVRWTTTTIVAGRRLRGRIFIVPMTTNVWETNGTMTTATRDLLQTSASTLISAFEGQLVVWARPFAGTPGNPSRAGSHGIVTGAQVPDMAVTLRSRRD